MSAARQLPLTQRDQLYIFSVNHPEATLRYLAQSAPDTPDPERPLVSAAAALLGLDSSDQSLDLRHVELFDTSDLAGLGLPNYLATAYEIEESEIAPHRDVLAGLSGNVLLLVSDALPLPSTLFPVSELTLLAHLAMTPPEVSLTRLRATAPATPQTAQDTPIQPQPFRHTGKIIAAALLLTILVFWLGFTFLANDAGK